LKDKAILFEKLGKSRTYFIFDEDAIEFNIIAYFTLAIQVLRIPDELLSGRKAKVFDGFSSKIRGVKITEFPAILIGQLGKNELYQNSISGSEVIEYCLAILLEGQEKLGGRIIMLECKAIPYLIKLYTMYGFQKLDKDYDTGELIQMVKILDEDEII
jgi:hypothetical protein